jgi:hypothetical protein
MDVLRQLAAGDREGMVRAERHAIVNLRGRHQRGARCLRRGLAAADGERATGGEKARPGTRIVMLGRPG